MSSVTLPYCTIDDFVDSSCIWDGGTLYFRSREREGALVSHWTGGPSLLFHQNVELYGWQILVGWLAGLISAIGFICPYWLRTLMCSVRREAWQVLSYLRSNLGLK